MHEMGNSRIVFPINKSFVIELKGRKTMTATIKTNTYKNGWNAVVELLTEGKPLDGMELKIQRIQTENDANSGLFHYAQGAKDCLKKYEQPGIAIPDKML